MPGEVKLSLYSTFMPPSSAIARGLSLCRSQPDLRFFSRGTQVFLPLQKSTLSQKHLPFGYCALGSCKTVRRQPEAPLIYIRPTRLSCALPNSAPGAASKND